MKFSAAPFDSTTWLLTLLVFAVLIFCIIMIITFTKSKLFKFFLSAGLTGVFIYCYCISPKNYFITESHLVISAPSKKIVVPLSSLREVRRLDKKELKGTVRMKGIGGLFGFTGKFYSKNLGSFEGYFTNQNNLVMVRCEKTYIISPDNPSLFLDKINSIIAKQR